MGWPWSCADEPREIGLGKRRGIPRLNELHVLPRALRLRRQQLVRRQDTGVHARLTSPTHASVRRSACSMTDTLSRAVTSVQYARVDVQPHVVGLGPAFSRNRPAIGARRLDVGFRRAERIERHVELGAQRDSCWGCPERSRGTRRSAAGPRIRRRDWCGDSRPTRSASAGGRRFATTMVASAAASRARTSASRGACASARLIASSSVSDSGVWANAGGARPPRIASAETSDRKLSRHACLTDRLPVC